MNARPPDGFAVRWKRAIVWAFALVLAGFSTATIVSQRLASAIDAAAQQIVNDFAPSVVALANARSELHRLQDFTSDYVEGGGRSEDWERVASSRAELSRAGATYELLPFLPGERELWWKVAADIHEVDGTLDRTVGAVRRGDRSGARRLVIGDLRTVVNRASADILSDIELNAAAADSGARLIAHRRKASMWAAAVLNGASVALTVVVALLIYSLIAQHNALQRQHASLLEEANAELEIFANRLSHDIVSPLASTRLAIEVALRKAEDAEAVRRSLGRGLQGLDRATGIAQALLDFARAGARPGPAERGDVGEVVGEVLDELRPLADKTGAHLDASVPEHASVACNKGLLTSALSNLVRNAITYLDGTPDKRVEVLAFDAGDRLRVEVRDNGRGLPPGAASRIFEPYVRGPASTQPGLGLGLATVKRIVETHGGAVGVESRAGAGARFWIELPKVA